MSADASNLLRDCEGVPGHFRVNSFDLAGLSAARRFPMRESNIIDGDCVGRGEIAKFRIVLTTLTGAANAKASASYPLKSMGGGESDGFGSLA